MLEAFVRWWTGKNDADSCREKLLLGCLILIFAATLALGVPRLRVNGHDVFPALDGAWRVLNGQRPAADFYAMWGPVWHILLAAGLVLAGNQATGLGYSVTIAAVLIGIWAWLLLRRRMTSAPFFLACVTLVMMAVAPFQLGLRPNMTGFAMTYNRIAYALTGLVLLECLLPSHASDRWSRHFSGGFSTGFAVAVLLLFKISYGLVALGLAGLSIVFRYRERARMTGAAVGFAVFFVPLLGYLRFDLLSLFREYSLLAAIRGDGVTARSVARRLYEDRFEACPVVLLTLLTVMASGVTWRRGIVLTFAALVTIGAGGLLGETNQQSEGLVLTAVLGLLLLNEITCAFRRSALTTQGAAVLLAFGLLAVTMPLSLDVAGFTMALEDKLVHPHAGYRFRASHLAGLEFFDGSDAHLNDNGKALVDYTEEGLDLLRAHTRPEESVLGFGMSNPFSYGLLRPPPHGGAVYMANTNLSEKIMPPPDRLIGDADVILIPTYDASERQVMKAVLDRYQDLLAVRYVPLAQSKNWKLYRRRAVDSALGSSEPQSYLTPWREADEGRW